MIARPQTDAMVAARRADSATKPSRVLAAIDHLLHQGTAVTFAAVAREARVSAWLVYTPELREAIEAGQARQAALTAENSRAAQTPPQGLTTELALARAEIARLRTERHQHQRQLQAALGARVDHIAKTDLIERVDELTRRNKELSAALSQAQSDNGQLAGRVVELEDDLAAARTSLRRMIRAENRPAAVTTTEGEQP